MRINLGCGKNYLEGWTNLDRFPGFRVDVSHNLELPLPFPSASCSEINAFHILEHIVNFVPLVNECHRVLSPEGLFHIRVPWFQGHWGCGDPTHVRFFNHLTFRHWSDWYDQSPQINCGCRFKEVSVDYVSNTAWKQNPWLAAAGICAIEEMILELQKS